MGFSLPSPPPASVITSNGAIRVLLEAACSLQSCGALISPAAVGENTTFCCQTSNIFQIPPVLPGHVAPELLTQHSTPFISLARGAVEEKMQLSSYILKLK